LVSRWSSRRDTGESQAVPAEPRGRATPHFHEELRQLTERLLSLGGLAEERLRAAVHGLVERTPDQLDRVIQGDDPLNQLHIEVDGRCFRLLALYQPMATDLRTIVSAVKINGELERVGDLAVNVAEAGRRYLRHAPVKALEDLPRMADIAQGMVRDALDAFVRRDADLAQRVLAEDDTLDELRMLVFRDLLGVMTREPATIEPSLDLLLVSRHFERIGDHATNIAEDVIFMVTARDVRHYGTAPDPGPSLIPAVPLQPASPEDERS
jgi:phosphate transport system protein